MSLLLNYFILYNFLNDKLIHYVLVSIVTLTVEFV